MTREHFAYFRALALCLVLTGCASKGPRQVEELPPPTQSNQVAQKADADARFREGVSYAKAGATDKAIAVFQDLTNDYPDLPGPYNNLAVLYASRGRYDDARRVLLDAIQLQPDLDTVHENLGDIYLKLAVNAYQRASQVNEGNRRAHSKTDAVRELLKPGVQREEPVPVTACVPEERQDVLISSQAPKVSAPTITPPLETPPEVQSPLKQCYALGPISNMDEAMAMFDWLQQKGLSVYLGETEMDVVAYYHVYLPPLADRRSAERKVIRLREMGLTDVTIIRRGSLANGVSLGTYRKQASVKRRLPRLRQLGMEPEVELLMERKQAYRLEIGPSTNTMSLTQAMRTEFPDVTLESAACRDGLQREKSLAER